MNETQPALVNFTVETFPNERDMEFHLAQASKRFEVCKAMVGWVFEYENAEAYQACQSLWKEIEQAIEVEDGTPVIRQAFRGVVLSQTTL